MKVILGILIVIIILLSSAVAYLAGSRKNTPSPTPTPASTPTPTFTPIPSPALPSPSPQTVTGGGVLSFPRYSLIIPADWTIKRETPGPDSERLILGNDTLGIIILQGGFGGSVCLYPGDPDSEGPSARYTAFVEITNQSGDLFRRSTPENGKGFALCQHTQYGWGAPTLYGAISLKLPSTPSSSDLAILDNVIHSLRRL